MNKGINTSTGSKIIITVVWLELLVLGYAWLGVFLDSVPGSIIWSMLITVIWGLLVGAPGSGVIHLDVEQSSNDGVRSDKHLVCVTPAAKGVVTVIITEALVITGTLWHDNLLGTWIAAGLCVFAVGMWVIIMSAEDPDIAKMDYWKE